MADQLSLRLEADKLPDLPDLRPMLPRPLPGPFDSDQHLFEPGWGGERALVWIGPSDVVGGGEIRIRGAAGNDVTAALPELAGLAVRVVARSATEVVVDVSGWFSSAFISDAKRKRRPSATQYNGLIP